MVEFFENGVAIIGMSGRFPQAGNLDELWEILVNGKETISHFNGSEIDGEANSDDPDQSDQKYVGARGIIENIEMFDADFFGYYPREAARTDPQHRLWLEVAWEALEGAGYTRDDYTGAVGVFSGCLNNNYQFYNLLSNRKTSKDYLLMKGSNTFNDILNNNSAFLATKTAYKFNLRGPAINVQTACSTSLTAVVMAVQSLLQYESDICIAGGVTVTVPQKLGYFYQEGAISSNDGHCRPFDEKAAGTVFSNGAGAVVLKRLGEAIEDRDNILAVIRGAALNNDGADKVGYTAPSVNGQAECIRTAIEYAAIEASTISFVETHGTATPLGDPIEIAGLAQAFGNLGNQSKFCGISSIKGNIGHCDTAAGIAGLIKTVLCLQHRKLVPTVHFEKANPKLNLDNTPFYVVDRLQEWKSEGIPLRAGVSSFGVGGTNAHVVLEEAPEIFPTEKISAPQIVLISARTENAVDVICRNLAAYLERNSDLQIADVAFTLQKGRRKFPCRRAIVCSDIEDARTKLSDTSDHGFRNTVGSEDIPVAFMFPGQGSQYVAMGKSLYEHAPLFRDIVDECARILAPKIGCDLRGILYPTGDFAAAGEKLRQTRYTQPAIFVVEYALARQLIDWGIKPSAFIGHSIGEFVAATLAGVWRLEDGLKIIAERSRLIGALPPGVMLSVRTSVDRLKKFISDSTVGKVDIAAVNAPELCVASGPAEVIELLRSKLEASDIPCRPLVTSHAFHSSMMDAALEPFRTVVSSVALSKPTVPIMSTLTGDWLKADEAQDPEHWVIHARSTVLFAKGIASLLGATPHFLLEVGPQNTLSTLAKQQIGTMSLNHDCGPVPTLLSTGKDMRAEWHSVLNALSKLWLHGHEYQYEAIHKDIQPRLIPLPTYPFERKRFWTDRNREENCEKGQNIAEAKEATVTSFQNGSNPVANQFYLNSLLMQQQASSHSANQSLDATLHTNGGFIQERGVALSRVENFQKMLSETLEDISGFEIDKSAFGTSFIELGIDSLLLTQFSLQIKKLFSVKIAFRQLIDSYPCIESLAGHLDETLPPDALSELVKDSTAGSNTSPQRSQELSGIQGASPNSPQYNPGWGMPSTLPFNGAAAIPMQNSMPTMQINPMLQMAILNQIQFTNQMLAMMSGGLVTPAATTVPNTALLQPSNSVSAAPSANTMPVVSVAESKKTPAGTPSEDEESAPKKAFGAMARIYTSMLDMTPKQKDRFDALVKRYNDKTKKSKQYTQDYRGVLADPRSITGFSPTLKEIIYPIVAQKSKDSKLWDLDGNEYVDVLSGFGSNFFGWQPDFIVKALTRQIELGYEIGPQTHLAGEVAEMLKQLIGFDRFAFCNTGSEAVLCCMRVARTVTGRNKIAIFQGSYHGMFDEVIVRSTKKNEARPAAPGIVRSASENIVVVEYGTQESLAFLREHGDELAAIMVEPVQSRRLNFQPKQFLHDLRKLCDDKGIVYIFDEVITGFRTAPGGAQEYFGVKADMASYGKVVGGGLPLGVVGGKRQYMDALDGGSWQYGDNSVPTVGVTYFAGTFVRHPLALAAAKEVLQRLKEQGPELQLRLGRKTAELAYTLNKYMEEQSAPVRIDHFGPIWMPVFTEEEQFTEIFFCILREKGIHIRNGFPCFFTTAHTDDDVVAIVNAFKSAITEMQESEFIQAPSKKNKAVKKKYLDNKNPPVPGAKLGKDEDGDPAWFILNPETQKYVKLGEGS